MSSIDIPSFSHDTVDGHRMAGLHGYLWLPVDTGNTCAFRAFA